MGVFGGNKCRFWELFIHINVTFLKNFFWGLFYYKILELADISKFDSPKYLNSKMLHIISKPFTIQKFMYLMYLNFVSQLSSKLQLK